MHKNLEPNWRKKIIEENPPLCDKNDGLRIFVTFGDGDFRYRRSASRLVSQINRLQLYDLTFALNGRWLKNTYPEIFRSIIKNSIEFPFKGYGYWVWKYCALEYLGCLYPNSIIHYADCGHSVEFSEKTDVELERCLEECLLNGYLGWELPDCREIEFTKSELSIFMNASMTDINSNQIDASQFLLSSNNAVDISRKALSVFQNNFHLLLDQTTLPQSVFFKEHRHDQSLLSLLWKENWQLKNESIIEKPFKHDRQISFYSKTNSNRLLFLVEEFLGRCEKHFRIKIWRLIWK